jgi:DNA-binding NtrC family response regulator
VREEAGSGPTRLSPAALAALERYDWPGNVRELRNAVERAVALCEGDVIEVADLPESLGHAARSDTLREAVRGGRLGLEAATAEFERGLLVEALERCGWNQTHAAAQLGITRRLLKLKLDRHGLAKSD